MMLKIPENFDLKYQNIKEKVMLLTQQMIRFLLSNQIDELKYVVGLIVQYNASIQQPVSNQNYYEEDDHHDQNYHKTLLVTEFQAITFESKTDKKSQDNKENKNNKSSGKKNGQKKSLQSLNFNSLLTYENLYRHNAMIISLE